MRYTLSLLIILPLLVNCQCAPESKRVIPVIQAYASNENPYAQVEDIPAPPGFIRFKSQQDSFGEWLRNVRLKRDRAVHLFNGKLKENQDAQFAVLKIPVGNKDLQQCADAVMRLRATWLYQQNRYDEIIFYDNNHTAYRISAGNNFEKYLEKVFGMCGTLSLEKQLTPIRDINQIQPDDVFIKGGSPGHAVIVMDVVMNESGKKLFLLAQSYMPAQEIHILVNPTNKGLSPWYEVDNSRILITPEWDFSTTQLRKF